MRLSRKAIAIGLAAGCAFWLGVILGPQCGAVIASMPGVWFATSSAEECAECLSVYPAAAPPGERPAGQCVLVELEAVRADGDLLDLYECAVCSPCETPRPGPRERASDSMVARG